MKNFIIPSLLLLLAAACGGADTSTASGVTGTASVSAGGTTLDVTGTWTVTATTCTGFPVVSSFPANVQSTTNSVQQFEGCSMQSPITCSDGTLDTNTGDMVFCYSDTLASCAIKCTGVYATGSPVALNCNDLSSGTCTMTIQK